MKAMNLSKQTILENVSVDENGCWIWQKSVRTTGYGQIRRKGKNLGAHRVSWEQFMGPIPLGLGVPHSCDVPLCCNPAHLFLGTQADNMRDAKKEGRVVAGPGLPPGFVFPRKPAECVECRASFMAANDRSKYCSNACSLRASRRRRAA